MLFVALFLFLIFVWLSRRYWGPWLADVIIDYALRDKSGYHLEGYMLRYWIFKPRQWAWLKRWPRLGYLFRISVRVHCILRSDTDRHTHDHPSWSASVLLRNGYAEWVPPPDRRGFVLGFSQPGQYMEALVCKHRRAGDIILRRATDRHRLELIEPAWSLFIMGPWSQDWGFYVPNVGKLYWRQYLDDWTSV